MQERLVLIFPVSTGIRKIPSVPQLNYISAWQTQTIESSQKDLIIGFIK